MILEAILLGFSTGTYCAMYCGPVLIPFLFGEERQSYGRNAALTGTFLLGRLVMYFILGAAFGAAGLLASDFFDPVLARVLSVYACIFCGIMLLCNSFGGRFPWGKCENGCKAPKLRKVGNDWVTALVTGLSVGLHICPPLWTAICRSVFAGNGSREFFYFIFFYIGSLPFFIPLLGIPFLTKRIAVLKKVSRITQFLAGTYFLIFNGLIPLVF